MLLRVACLLFSLVAFTGCPGLSDKTSKTEDIAKQAKERAKELEKDLRDRGAKLGVTIKGNVETVNGRIKHDSRRYAALVSLDGTSITDDDLKLIVEYHQVLNQGHVRDQRSRKPIRGIGLLKLDNTGITDAAIPHLKQLSGLNTLTIRNTTISEQGLRELRDSLGKSGTRIVDRESKVNAK